jgi:uncharacterized protein (DUF952 family)
MRRIYHLTTRAGWEADADAPYRAALLATEGFIHCSNADQVARSANRFFADVPELLVLHVDAGRLSGPLRDEPGGTAGELFPHIYGPINRDAVLRIEPLRRGPDGQWVFAAP